MVHSPVPYIKEGQADKKGQDKYRGHKGDRNHPARVPDLHKKEKYQTGFYRGDGEGGQNPQITQMEPGNHDRKGGQQKERP
jgi:hypothetical protein